MMIIYFGCKDTHFLFIPKFFLRKTYGIPKFIFDNMYKIPKFFSSILYRIPKFDSAVFGCFFFEKKKVCVFAVGKKIIWQDANVDSYILVD